MTSEAKIAANRRNAKRSTGPRTDAGKARTRRNALQHGLAVPAHLDRGFSVQIEALATWFSEHEPAARECTRIAAEAHLEVLRVRQAKVELINAEVKNATARAGRGALGDDVTNALAISTNIKRLMALERYERRALSRRRRALCVPRRRAQGRTLPGDRVTALYLCKGESRFRSRQAAKLRYRSQRRRVALAIQPRQDGP